MKNKRLGEMLVDAGILSEKQIEEAIAFQKNSGKRLGTILLENHYINETQLIEVLRIQLGIDFIDLNEYSTPPEPLCPILRATHSVERAIFLFR